MNLSILQVKQLANLINLIFVYANQFKFLGFGLIDWFVALFCIRAVIGATGHLFNVRGSLTDAISLTRAHDRRITSQQARDAQRDAQKEYYKSKKEYYDRFKKKS